MTDLAAIQNWATAPLGEIATVDRSGINPSDIETGTLFVGLENMTSEGTFDSVQAVQNGDISSTKFRFTQDHVLYGKLRPYLQKIALPDFEGVCSTDILPILPSERIDRRYLCYYLRQPQMVELATTRAAGANLPRLSPKTLLDFDVTFPEDLAEQKRIAAILDKADAIRRKRQQALALTDDLLRSTFLDMFGDPVTNPKGWERMSIGDLVDDMRGGASLTPEDFQEFGFPILHKGGIKPFGRIELDPKKKTFCTPEYADSKPRSIVPSEYLAVTLRDLVPTGPAIALMANLEHYDIPEYLLAQGAYGMRPIRDRIHPDYLVTLSNLDNMRTVFKKYSVGSTQIHMRNEIFRGIEVPVPPVELQNQFGKVVEVAWSLRRRNERVEQDNDYWLFESCLQRAFRGEL